MVVVRNYVVYRSAWKVFLTGFLEPVFYLLSIGVGVGKLIQSFEFNGHTIPYAEFVAPGMLAASAFNGALLDSTFNVFFKLRYEKLYDQMLATPLTTHDIARGEIVWSQLRGASYSAAFLVVMWALGLVHSWWALAALPATILIGFAVAAVCMALTTWMTSWQDFDKVTLVQLPLFLFSGTFFPVDNLGPVGELAAKLTPLWHGVNLTRMLCLDTVDGPTAVVNTLVLVTVMVVGWYVAIRTLARRVEQ
jgi:lipooligosaccharide transport system permease protein